MRWHAACAKVLAAVVSGWLVGTVLGTGHAAVGAEPSAGLPRVAANVRRLSLPAPAGMTRAEVYACNTVTNPRAVLVLCPGCNGNGEDLARQMDWQDFARANGLVLCALSFASPEAEILAHRGYYLVGQGSGDVLLRGIRQAFGRDLPILAYGFSGGAHFTAGLVNWKPERVLGWCADSAAWWEEPAAQPADTPPGIVACGDADPVRYGASLTFFAQGRSLGRPWTWVSLGGTEHTWSASLDQFVRAYFAALLHGAPPANGSLRSHAGHPAGCWRDVDTGEELSAQQAALQPTLACWLPDRSVGALWSNLHRP